MTRCFVDLATSLSSEFYPALPTLLGHWKPLVRFYHRVNSNEVGQIDNRILRKGAGALRVGGT